LAGPCVVENEENAFQIAEQLKNTAEKQGFELIYKASYKKANRSKIDSFTGIGDEKALNILKKIKDQLGLTVLTDIHEPREAEMAAEAADILQIPAFLCRQTNLLVAAANTGKTVNIKKGQFMSPDAMGFAVKKIRDSGNENVILTERGTTFGYNDLIVDYRSIPAMQSHNVPVVLDVTHSLQEPNQTSGVTGGKPELIETMAKAGVAAGVDGIFLETHPDPPSALSDGQNMLPLSEFEPLVQKLLSIYKAL
ncbi:MAG: 3-deoxy-8-phosphooctulonate synthase, partial [Flavobacteriales bacterium]